MRTLADHLAAPADIDLPEHPVEGCAGGACGDLVRFFLGIEDGIVVEAAARARGRGVVVAAASALCEAARGLPVLEAARLGLTSLHPDFAALAGEDRERALVAEDAFHHALGLYVREHMRAGERVVGADARALTAIVGMSGGVDSAVALHEMHAAGDGAVAGVTLRLWIDPHAPDPDSACCAPDSVRQARWTCHALGVPHVSLDLRGAFARSVVQPFVERYKAGETPNPCVGCNGGFRLDELVACADALGAAAVATGHYVRAEQRGDRVLVRRGVDTRKDQSYMLATLDPATLARYRFPLGHLTKDQTRARAGELGLRQATAAESQEICFLGGGDYRQFLSRAGALGTTGEIRTTNGAKLGDHDGIARFTPGQRRGLAVTAPIGHDGALYVLDADPASGTVTVGGRNQLRRQEVVLREAACLEPGTLRADVRLRYRSGGSPATIEWLPDAMARLTFDEPVIAPAPGQLACMYDERGVVVGAGTICRPDELTR